MDSEGIKRIKNKQRRQRVVSDLKHKHNKERHSLRKERAKEERANPQLREERIANNIPETLESKRVYDETVGAAIEGSAE